MVIHSVAIGTLEGGNTTYGFSKLDEDSLRAIAYNTRGKFFNAGSEERLSASFDEIINYKERLVRVELARYLLSVCAILVIIFYFLANTRFRVFP